MAFPKAIKKLVLSSKLFQRVSAACCVEHQLLPNIFVRTPSDALRSLLFLPESERTTQLNQDIFALIVNRFASGFFLEIGANDGFELSNTIYLEESFGWNGLLIEANPEYEDSLKRRKSQVMIAAVADAEGEYEFCSAGLYGGIVDKLDTLHQNRTVGARSIKVWGTTLRKILQEKSAPKRIEFVSIDVEGAEVSVVEQLCSLEDYRFSCGCIEHNGREADYKHIARRLEESGYEVAWERQTQHDLFFIDVNRSR